MAGIDHAATVLWKLAFSALATVPLALQPLRSGWLCRLHHSVFHHHAHSR